MGKSTTKKLIRKIAKEEGVSVKEVESIVSAQSEYLRYVMTSSGFETMKFPYLGKFVASMKALKYINDKPLRDAFSGKQ